MSDDCWTKHPEMADDLVRMYKETDISGTNIAAQLSKKWGICVNRSMVFGKLKRLGVLQDFPRARTKGIKKNPTSHSPPRTKTVAVVAKEPKEKPFAWNDTLDRFIMDQRNNRGASASQIGHYLMRAHGVRPSTGDISARLNYLTEKGFDIAEATSELVALNQETGGVPFREHNFFTCHWPVSGERENTFFCGRPLYHSAYCKEHTMRSCASPPRYPNPLGAK